MKYQVFARGEGMNQQAFETGLSTFAEMKVRNAEDAIIRAHSTRDRSDEIDAAWLCRRVCTLARETGRYFDVSPALTRFMRAFGV